MKKVLINAKYILNLHFHATYFFVDLTLFQVPNTFVLTKMTGLKIVLIKNEKTV